MTEYDNRNPEQAEILTASQEISAVLAGYGEAYGFDSITCKEISNLPFTEAFEVACGYLLQAGLDTEEVLAPFIEQPD